MNEDLELRKRVEELNAIVAADRAKLDADRDAKLSEERARADDRKSAIENAKFLGIEYRPLCACGCGEPVEIARWTDKRNGRIKGEPLRFLPNHSFPRTCGGRAHRTPEWKAFHYAKTRCRNRKRRDYPNYGGRGILFCFVSFEQFLKEVGPKPGPEYTLDRIDTNGHYAPGNVKWSTPAEQNANRRPRCEWTNADEFLF